MRTWLVSRPRGLDLLPSPYPSASAAYREPLMATPRVGLTTIGTVGLCCSGWSASSESRARLATTSLGTVALLGIAIALPLAGCFLSPIPDLRGPTDFAREMIPRCESFSEESSERVRADSLVEAVEPAYVFVPAGPLLPASTPQRGAPSPAADERRLARVATAKSRVPSGPRRSGDARADCRRSVRVAGHLARHRRPVGRRRLRGKRARAGPPRRATRARPRAPLFFCDSTVIGSFETDQCSVTEPRDTRRA